MNTCSQPRCGKSSYSTPPMRPRNDWEMEGFPIAMAYVPMQQFKSLFELDEALRCGTIFPELSKPFRGWKGGRTC